MSVILIQQSGPEGSVEIRNIGFLLNMLLWCPSIYLWHSFVVALWLGIFLRRTSGWMSQSLPLWLWASNLIFHCVLKNFSNAYFLLKDNKEITSIKPLLLWVFILSFCLVDWKSEEKKWRKFEFHVLFSFGSL